MSLFGKLIHLRSDKLCPLENFHTEIVAHVLQNDPELTLSWLQLMGVTDRREADKISVNPQDRYEPIEGRHDNGSRPDIVIRITKGEHREVVFIESKVGSPKNHEQLLKYRDHLHEQRGVVRRTLIFISRNYESEEDLGDNDVKFVQRRWADFYRFLSGRKFQSDTTIQLLQFMKENYMSQDNQFTAIDIIALTNRRRAFSIVQATLEDKKITQKFANEAGGAKPKWWDGDEKYGLGGHATSSGQIWYSLGYWFSDEQLSDSPTVGMTISVDPKGAEFPALDQAVRKFAEARKGSSRKWEHRNPGGWETIECTKKLEVFLATEDHVMAIKIWFEELLQDAVDFRIQNPKLPWNFRVTEDSNETLVPAS